MTRIKICGITRNEDVIDAVYSGADALGFVFYDKSPRFVTREKAMELTQLVFPFVSLVGLFVNPDEAYVREVLESVPLNVLQFHGDESADFCSRFGRPYLKAVRVRPGLDLVQYAAEHQGAQGLLLDAFVEGTPGGTGTTFDWSLVPQDLPLPVILSGGLNAVNVSEAMLNVRPYAVDVSSGVEAGKGIKDAAKIAAFINEVNRMDLQLSGRKDVLRGHRRTVR
jgi:phosphoribosylanthranilate isomerase